MKTATITKPASNVIDLDTHRAGKRADTSRVSYLEGWASQFPLAQHKVERDRVRRQVPRHRASRPLFGHTPPEPAA